MTTELHFIYSLTTTLDNQRVVFYVGRTNDTKRRLGEHRRAALTGHEDKYSFIRNVIKPAGAAWEMEVLHEITAAQLEADMQFDDYEDFEIVRHHRAGHPLQNMRAGSALKHAELDALSSSAREYRTPADIRAMKRDLAAVAELRAQPAIDPRAAAAQQLIDAAAAGLQNQNRQRAAKERAQAEKRAAAAKKREAEREAWIAEQKALWAKQNGNSTV